MMWILTKLKSLKIDIIEKIKSEKPEIIDAIQSSGKLEENTEKLLVQASKNIRKQINNAKFRGFKKKN